MNNTTQLHPIMAQALAPFTGVLATAPIVPAAYRNPPAGYGQVIYDWDAGIGESIVCHLDHEPAERGARERGTGLQLEPDYAESVSLAAAYLRGVDILPLLSESQIQRIEELALQSLEE